MKKKISLVLLLIAISMNSQTKEKVASFLENNPYFNDYHEELFFLHTNKTVYFSGEDIWFAAYILDKMNEKPSEITKNLHINLYNSEFKLIEQKLYHAVNGKANGQFKLLENLTSGDYYLELDTNWNKNFKKGTVFKIEVINLDSPEKKITTATNNLGLVNKNQLTLKNEVFIIRNLNEYNSTSFNFYIDKNLYESYKGETLFAVLHKNNIIQSCAGLEINNKKKYTIKFDELFLLNGVNTITLFNKNNEVLAKKLFWNFNSKIGEVQITKNKETKDSLFLNIKLPKNTSKSTLSISVLNAENELLFNETNILKSFLDVDYKEIKNNKIDELLSNKNYTFSFSRIIDTILYKNETGVVIKGKVNSKIKDFKNFKIMFSSKENNLFLVNNINEDNSFKFDSLHIKHPSTYTLSLINNEEKTKRGKFYVYDNYHNYIPNSILKGVRNNDIITSKEINRSSTEYLISRKKDVITLEEIKIKTIIDREKKIKDKYKNIFGGSSTSFYIPDENLAFGTDIFDYLNNIPGLVVYYVPLTNKPLIFNTRGPNSITGSQVVNVKLNGTPLGEDLDPIIGLLTTDFEIITVNITGAGEGLRGSNGVVNLIQKTETEYKKRKHKNYGIKETIKGFEKSLSKYVKSELEFNDTHSLKAFNVIDWIPDFKLESNNNRLLKIPLNYDQRNIKLIINGFSTDGTLIHKSIIINDVFK